MDLSYPVGKFVWPDAVMPEQRRLYIDTIKAAAGRFRQAIAGLDDT